MSEAAARYKNHRFPTGIIAHAVSLYCRFPLLSLRHVENMLPERGIVVSYETIPTEGRAGIAARTPSPGNTLARP